LIKILVKEYPQKKLDAQGTSMTTCFQTLTNVGLRKDLQAVDNTILKCMRLVLNSFYDNYFYDVTIIF